MFGTMCFMIFLHFVQTSEFLPEDHQYMYTFVSQTKVWHDILKRTSFLVGIAVTKRVNPSCVDDELTCLQIHLFGSGSSKGALN